MNTKGFKIIIFLVVSLMLLLSSATGSALAQGTWDPCSNGLCAPSVESQFAGIVPKGGQPMAFSYWHGGSTFIGRDPAVVTHYQGINRFNDSQGVPMFILTRNGNPKTAGDDYPGELVFVWLGTRSGTEIIGSNCASTSGGKCQPGANDWTSSVIDLTNGFVGNSIGWKHPGSGQIIGNYIFIPLEKTCNSTGPKIPCSGNEETRGAILIVDLIDRVALNLITQDERGNLPTIGTLAVTQIAADKYLLGGFGGEYNAEKAMTFWELTAGDLGASGLKLDYITDWNANNLKPDNDDDAWRCGRDCGLLTLNYQMMNFIRQKDGVLYLLGTDNDSATLTDGADWAKLFKVERSGNTFTITYVAEKHLYLNDPMKLGDLDAAAGLYVSPTGRLILYTAPHDNDGWEANGCTNPSGTQLCKALQFGEFAYILPLAGAAVGFGYWWIAAVALLVAVGIVALVVLRKRIRVT